MMFLTLSHQNPSRLLGQIHSGMASACSVTSGRDLGQEQGREEGPEANREIPEVKPCCEACVTPFPSPHRALMCHLRGCLSQGSFPSLSKIWRTSEIPQAYCVGASSTKDPPGLKGHEFCDSEPWKLHPSACRWGTAPCLPRPGDGCHQGF